MADCEHDCVFQRALVLSFSFSTPPGSVGIPGQTGNHLFVMESTDGRERQVEFLTCADGRASGDTTVRRAVARWIVCPESGSGLNSGHVMLVWVEDGIRYAVSLHSDTDLNRKIALAMVERMTPVTG
jgi:hypothetical protein